MYAFAQRDDSEVHDEPLYADYCIRFNEDRPYLKELLASQENDGEKVVQDLILGPCDKKVLYLKHMGKQIKGLDQGFLQHTKNVILVREPRGLILSYHKALGAVNVHDTCLPDQVELLETLIANGQTPAVVVVEDLLKNPEGMLRLLCEHVGIPFQPSMLSWEAGPKAVDGIWAYHWYANTHKATGFDQAVQTKAKPLPEELVAVNEECQTLFDKLRPFAMTP